MVFAVLVDIDAVNVVAAYRPVVQACTLHGTPQPEPQHYKAFNDVF
jgi:hypothetical protein